MILYTLIARSYTAVFALGTLEIYRKIQFAYLREKENLLFPAADIRTSGTEILPVLLEELKSASLPGKEKGRVKI